MYELKTSTGLRLTTTTVETVVSALTRQFDRHHGDQTFGWSVTTPHGTVVTDAGAGQVNVDGPVMTDARVEHAYGLLVRDHLSHAAPVVPTGLLRTS